MEKKTDPQLQLLPEPRRELVVECDGWALPATLASLEEKGYAWQRMDVIGLSGYRIVAQHRSLFARPAEKGQR